jgi:hypothetical protein
MVPEEYGHRHLFHAYDGADLFRGGKARDMAYR